MIPASQDDRIHPTDATKRRMKERGLEFPVPEGPLTVVCEDPITHTPAFPICGEPDCVCAQLEYEAITESAASKPRRSRRTRTWNAASDDEHKRNIAPLNGNRPFSILK